MKTVDPRNRVILDTNIVSYVMRNSAEAKLYAPHLKGPVLAISFITVGELYCWAENSRWGSQKRSDLDRTLRNFAVVNYDTNVARCYGRIVVERKRSGNQINNNDAWIAACAVRHQVPLITHNAKDFMGINDLQVITEAV